MKPFLKKIATVFGILSLVFPVIMGILWFRYVKEQELFYGTETISNLPCEPFGMVTSRVDDRLMVSWKTKDACAGFMLLGETYADFSGLPYKVLSSQGEAPTKEHSVYILRQDEIRYKYVIIVSSGEWYGINGNPFQFR